MWRKLQQLKRALLHIDSRTIYLYSLATGLLTGGVAILFYKIFKWLLHLFYNTIAHESLSTMRAYEPQFFQFPESPARYILLVLPAVGGLVTGLIAHYWAKEVSGTGVDEFLETFHNRKGVLRKRTSIAKFFASLATIATGGSAGKEGPMVLIGSAIGSLFGRFVKMGARAQRTLLLAGAAGGLGAIFRAPLGGAITAVEVLYKEDFEADSLIPCIISSVTAYTTFATYVGFGHTIQFHSAVFHSPIELVFYVGLGIICTLAGYLFVRMFRFMRESVFAKLPVPRILMPALGGFLVGCIGFFHPEVIGEGLEIVQRAIFDMYHGDWITVTAFFFLLAFLKMVATSLTIQSGGSGGALVPSLFIGAMIGGGVGTICHHFFPEMAPSVTPFIIVGMASFFSAVTNASLGALVMVCELTGGYELLPPLMIVAVISLILSHKWSLYAKQVKNKFYSKAHLYDMNPIALKDLHVSETFHAVYHRDAIVRDKTSLKEIHDIAFKTHETDFLIANEHGELHGIFSLKDFLGDDQHLSEVKELCLAEDLITRKVFFVTENDSLYKALQYLLESDFDKVPVVREAVQIQGGKPLQVLLGYIQYKDILRFYHTMKEEHM